MLFLGAIIVLFYVPRYWLLGGFIIVSAAWGFAEAGAEGAMFCAFLMSIIGTFIVMIRRTAKAFWRVERGRWDSRDFPADPQP